MSKCCCYRRNPRKIPFFWSNNIWFSIGPHTIIHIKICACDRHNCHFGCWVHSIDPFYGILEVTWWGIDLDGVTKFHLFKYITRHTCPNICAIQWLLCFCEDHRIVKLIQHLERELLLEIIDARKRKICDFVDLEWNLHGKLGNIKKTSLFILKRKIFRDVQQQTVGILRICWEWLKPRCQGKRESSCPVVQKRMGNEMKVSYHTEDWMWFTGNTLFITVVCSKKC